METTDYCDYKLSAALKAAGFDEPCRAHYTNDYLNDDPEDLSREVEFHYDWTSPYNYNRVVGKTSAPTLWHAQKWLRNKGIEVYVLLADDNAGYEWGIYDRNVCDNIDSNLGDDYKTYEQALSAGIARAVELIKKGE